MLQISKTRVLQQILCHLLKAFAFAVSVLKLHSGQLTLRLHAGLEVSAHLLTAAGLHWASPHWQPCREHRQVAVSLFLLELAQTLCFLSCVWWIVISFAPGIAEPRAGFSPLAILNLSNWQPKLQEEHTESDPLRLWLHFPVVNTIQFESAICVERDFQVHFWKLLGVLLSLCFSSRELIRSSVIFIRSIMLYSSIHFQWKKSSLQKL